MAGEFIFWDSPRQLASEIRKYDVNVMQATPATWRMLLTSNWQGSPNLKVICGGEALPRELANRLLEKVGSLWNIYGPTETTVWSTTCQVTANRPFGNEDAPEPIGRPIANTQTYILDKSLQPVPVGVIGELYIGGDGVARGYLKRPELNAASFLTNPFKSNSRIYKTGDLARYLPSGNIEYLGRIDNQVKIRGFRIEIGEIENILDKHPQVEQGVVIVREDTPGNKQLVAYIVSGQSQPSISELRQFLKIQLPQYMIPSAFVILESLPMTPNGKIDRKSLPMPSEIQRDSDATAIAPRNDLEMALTKIWEQTLGIKNIGIRDNFFELGGNSLLAVRLFAKIEKTFQKNLPLTAIFQSPTVEQLANILCSEPESSTWYSLVPIQPDGSRPPLFGIHYIYFKELSDYLGQEQPVYALHYGMGEVTNKALSLPKMEDLASHYIQEMRSLQPEGPYFLMGLSLGGMLAYEMAQQLVAQGQQVDLLAVFDTHIENNMKLLPLHQRLFNLLQMGSSQCLKKVKDNITRKFRRLKYGNQYLPHMYIPEVDFSILKAYTPKTYSGRVLLFKAKDHFSVNYGHVSPESGWRKFVDGELEIHEVPGGHLSILEEPYVQVVAEKLRDYLNRHSAG